MRRRIALDGITDDAIRILPELAARPDLELVRIYDPDARVRLRRLALLEPMAGALLQRLLTDEPAALAGLEVLSSEEAIALCPDAASARSAGAAQAELLQAIRDVADAVELAAATESLFARLLEVAVAATQATGGSLLLVEEAALRVRAAVGLEPELWAKVRLPIGAGLAGRAWAEARPFTVSGRADPSHFEIAHERHDVASALLVPLAHTASVRGVLCLHHATEVERFASADLELADALGAALGRVIERALAMREAELGAERSALARSVERALATSSSPAERDVALCRLAAERAGRGSATLWRTGAGPDAERLRFAASSLAGGALGAPTELAAGQGLDGRAARTREPILLRDADRLAYAALPLVDPDATLIGVLSVQCGENARPAAAIEHALRAIASEAAVLLARNDASARARERTVRAEALVEAAAEIVALRDPDCIAQALAARATLLCGASAVFVRVLDPVRGRHRLAAPRDGAQWHDAARVALDRRAAGEALRRRTPIEVDPASGDAEDAVLALPILAGDRALAVLSLHAEAPLGFDAGALAVAERLAEFAAIALDATLARTAPAPAEGLMTAAALDRRLDAEIARCAEAGAGSTFSLVTCRIENAAALGAATAAHALRAAARGVAEQLRPFDAAAATGEATLLVLLPVPGPAPTERVARLARAVAEAVAKDPEVASAALVFGHATHPGEAGSGERKTALLARADEPRIRIL